MENTKKTLWLNVWLIFVVTTLCGTSWARVDNGAPLPGCGNARANLPQNSAATKPQGHALLVGVDSYGNANIQPTPGSVADAESLARLLVEKFNFPPAGIKCLLNEQATAQKIADAFQSWLIQDTGPGERVFFHYSGHGAQIPDQNGDEADKLDEIFTPYDVKVIVKNNKLTVPDEDPNAPYKFGYITDDRFNDFIAQLANRRAVLIFDSCHSGTISRGLGLMGTPELPSRFLRLGNSRSVQNDEYSNIPPAAERDLKVIAESNLQGKANSVVVISAADSYQQAFATKLADGTVRGALSFLFERENQGPSPSVRDLAQRLKAGMEDLARRKLIGNSPQGFQVPQVEIIARKEEAVLSKPLFGVTSGQNEADARQNELENALGNPLSNLKVDLQLSQTRYRVGDRINYTISVSEPSFVYVLVFSRENKANCIYSSEDTPERTVKPGEKLALTARAQPPTGKDVWAALASKQSLNACPKEEDVPWDTLFRSIGIEELRRAIARTRGAGVRREQPLNPNIEWQTALVTAETIE